MTSPLTPSAALELWKRSVGLRAVPLRIAPPELRARYNEPMPDVAVPANSPPSKVLVSLPTDFSSSVTFRDVLAAVAESLVQAKPLIDHLTSRGEVMRKMQDLVIGHLGRKELTGFGYVVPRKPDDAPVEIPVDVWGGTIDWDKSTVSGNGLQFVAVGVVATAAIPKMIAASLPPPKRKQKAQRGRRPVKSFVIDAYDTLKAGDAIDFSKPMVETFHSLRALMQKTYPDRAGQFASLSDETIRKHITDLFQSDRNNAAKQSGNKRGGSGDGR